MKVQKTKIDDILYILDETAFVIEDELDGITKIFVPEDSFNSYCVLNPNINIIYPYNYKTYQVNQDSRLYKNTHIIITTESNAPVMSVMFSKGLCANPNYMTQAEAELVSNEQLDSLFENNNDVVSFMEFQYFTGCTRTGKRMFMNCENFERVELPKTITFIDERFATFGNALITAGKVSKLKYVGGVENVEMISSTNPFQYADSLETLNFTEKLKRKLKFNSANNKNATIHSSIRTFGDLSGLEEIETYAFQGITSLKEINLPKLTVVPTSSFYESNIKPILNWKNITEIGNSAFSVSNAREAYPILDYVPNMPNLTVIGTAAFQNPSVKGIGNMPNLTIMQTTAFNLARNLEYVGDMPKLTEIKMASFNNCNKLRRVGNIPLVTNIGMNAFEHCWELETIGNCDSLTHIDDRAFGRCFALSAYFPNVTRIGDYAFCMDTYNDPMEKPRIIEFGKSYNEITFEQEPFKACTKTKIICNGEELTEAQYTAVGATKPE